MTRTIDINDLPDFDVTDYLDDPGAVLEYLATVIVDGDPVLLEAALADIARVSRRTRPLNPPTGSV